jgi:hypothetical protein
MQRRKQIAAPKRQQYERKAANRTEGKSTATLREFPAHNHQAQVQQPHYR